ncbi:uncharacterized protein UTRI_01374_B [Ustilago trichophora]|uniref:FHA domain-containing protein n=1 Tax=Ustilago trichophora TaxID=86804 RepID=A0A5C3E698_9BASI|nr:uncharacterized protein UTRI_01374_B [Ustilago trichophora]
MWLLQGRFAEDSRQELSKLLKYGQTYTLGRKIPADIVIDSKFVSRVSCHITVASDESISSQLANVSDPLSFHNDVSLRPRVTIRFEANKSRKTFAVTQQRRSEATEVQVPADQEHVLGHGDSFALTTTISLRLVWKPMAVCFAAKVKESAISPLRKAALQLGIHLSPAKSRWRDGYTHLCLIQVKPTESVLCALLQARPIVTIEYFQELFRRAELPRHDPASLETCMDELDPATYQPTVDQQELNDLPHLLHKLLPDERRTYMLKGTTCVFFALPTEDAELSIYKSILAVAGAHVFTHNPQAENLQTKADFAQLLMPYKNSALSYWRNSGSKARSEAPDEGLVVLVSAVHDNTPWKDACTVACTNLRIAMPSGFHTITNAVFTAHVRAHLNSIPNASDEQAELPVETDAAPTAADPPAPPQRNTADDTVMEPTPQRRSPSAVTPAQAEASPADAAEVQSSAPTAEPPSTAVEQQRRPLTRRTRKPAQTSEDADSQPAPEAVQAGVASRGDAATEASIQSNILSSEVTAEPSSSQLTRAERSGLTRRTGASRARRSDIFDAMLRPDGATAEVGDGFGSISGDGVGASLNAGSIPRSRRYRMDLDEEDRAQGESLGQTQASEARSAASQMPESVTGPESNAQKRKSPPQRQVSGAEPGENAGNVDRTSKRARTAGPENESADHVPPSQPSIAEPTRIIRTEATTEAAGLADGAHPDTEPQFLQALNTQRAKGKKMDEFDAEFNRLQIAKPNTQTGTLDKFVGARTKQKAPAQNAATDEDYEAFKQMAEEELRIHVRGNFVQVDFVPLVRKKPPQQQQQQAPNGVQDAGKPNFKKFRPKSTVVKLATKVAAVKAPARASIALVLPESNDYGLGQSYWEDQQDGQSGPTSETVTSSRGKSSARTTARKGAASDDEDESIPQARGKARGRVALDPASVEGSAVDLDLDGLDSMDSTDEADMTTMLQRRHGSRSQRSAPAKSAAVATARGRKRPAALVEDSDEEMAAPSTASAAAASRKKRVPARAATMVFDDDDDDESGDDDNEDDGNFAGFGKSTSTRRRRDPPASGSGRARRSVF